MQFTAQSGLDRCKKDFAIVHSFQYLIVTGDGIRGVNDFMKEDGVIHWFGRELIIMILNRIFNIEFHMVSTRKNGCRDVISQFGYFDGLFIIIS